MKIAFCFLILFVFIASAEVVEDCLSIGLPVSNAVLSSDLFLVEMEGSLAQGDSLLKHYGGLFFLFSDSIAEGWPVVGLQVNISAASLVLFKEDVFCAVERMQQGLSEEMLASWILEHTWVTKDD